MVLDKLGNTLKSTFKKITSSLFIDEKLVNEITKDIQRALLQGDVNVKLVLNISNNIKKRALSEDIPKGMTQKEHLVKIVYDELVNFLGGPGEKINISKKPFKIMLMGLFGNGKTTTAGKLAKFYTNKGYKVAVIQTDTWRPAAYEQLKQLADKTHAHFFGIKDEKDPVAIFSSTERELKDYDIVIIDTAGRDALSAELIDELNKIDKAVQADEKLLVMGAEIGQAAEKQAHAFHDNAGVSGVVITRMDGTAKGGGAITACSISKAPVKFIGVGEKIADLESFIPERFVSRLLGMGDIESLLEKAREAISEEQGEELSKRFIKGEFNLIDLYNQMKAMKKMGPLNKVLEMIPGMGNMNIPKDTIVAEEEKIKKWKFIMDSCTKEELENPEVISAKRVERIAKGSGLSQSDVRDMIKHYRHAKKMMKMMKPGKEKNMQQMLKKMGGMKGFKF